MAIETVTSWLDWAAMSFPNFKMCYENESRSKRIKGLATIALSYLASSHITRDFFSEDKIAPQTDKSFVRVCAWEVCKFGALVAGAHITYKFATSFLLRNAYLGRAVIVGVYEAISSAMLRQAFQTVFFSKEVSSLNYTRKKWTAFFADHTEFFKEGYNKNLWIKDVEGVLEDTCDLIDTILSKHKKTPSDDMTRLRLTASAYSILSILNPRNTDQIEERRLVIKGLQSYKTIFLSQLQALEDLNKDELSSLKNLQQRYELLIKLHEALKSITDEKIKEVIGSPAQVFQEKFRINPQVEEFKRLMTFFGEPFISSKLISWCPSFFSTPILMSTVTSLVCTAFEQFLSYKAGFPSLNRLPIPEEVTSALGPIESTVLDFRKNRQSKALLEQLQLEMPSGVG